MRTDQLFSLSGKKILITGASSGIGRSTAIACARMGAQVILSARSAQKLESLLIQLEGEGHQILLADLAKEEDLLELVKQCPPLNGIVHSAGLVEPFPIQFLKKKKIDETFTLNFYAIVELTSLLLRHKKVEKGGSVVFISSIAGQHPFIGGTSYAASKAAIEAFSKTLALEYASRSIRSNCLSPAMVKTRIFDEMAENVAAGTVDEHLKKYPLGPGEPEDVANAAVFLLSDASRWITGINIRLDGGLLIGV